MRPWSSGGPASLVVGRERRQSFWPDDNYFGRSVGTIIWYQEVPDLITDQQVVLLRQKLMEGKTQQAAGGSGGHE